MLFSIIVPVYQAEKYLPDCLRSIEDQIFRDFEAVLVDDGSMDGCGEICDRFAEAYPGQVTVIHKQNEGLISARRAGIQAAKGDYVVSLDADDMLDAYCLKVLKDNIRKFDAPDVIIYRLMNYSAGRLVPDTCPPIGPDMLYQGEQKQIIYKTILKSSALNSFVTKAIKRSLVLSDPTDYRQYYRRDMTEDLLQSLYPITYASRILYTNEPLYYYRYNPESVSHSFSLQTAYRKNDLHVYRKLLDYLPQWGQDTPEVREHLHALWLQGAVNKMIRHFAAAQSFEERMEVLRYPWYSFVDETLPVPETLYPRTAHLWQLYTSGQLDELYRELMQANALA